jgi:hypothetical protein
MINSQDPKDLQKNADDVEITNGEEKIVNNDVNEQFGDDFILPEDEDDVKN